MFNKGAEWRDAGAGPDHDEGRRWIGRQAKAVRALHEDRQRAPRAQVLGEEAGAGPLIGAVVFLVAQHADGELRPPRVQALLPLLVDEVAAALARAQLVDELSLAAERVAVPLYGRAESLNVATAATVCLYASAMSQHADRS